MKAEYFVAAGAVFCALPVIFGLIVAKWDKGWSRSGETNLPARRVKP